MKENVSLACLAPWVLDRDWTSNFFGVYFQLRLDPTESSFGLLLLDLDGDIGEIRGNLLNGLVCIVLP